MHPWTCHEPDGSQRKQGPTPTALLSGSFRPLHVGHRELAAVAEKMLGRSVAFELSIENVDKPTIDAEEVARRIAQFHGLAPIYVTRAMGFHAKAMLFPGCTFVVGYDTAVRILDVKYAGDAARWERELSEIRDLGGRFLVAGRRHPTGEYLSAEQLAVPEAWRELFRPIAETAFRVDISSTQLRQEPRTQ